MNQFNRSLRTLHLRAQESRGASGMRRPRLSVPLPRTTEGATNIAARALDLKRILASTADTPIKTSETIASTTAMLVPDKFSSQALLNGRKFVEISHNGEIYQLRATRHGKLILTK